MGSNPARLAPLAKALLSGIPDEAVVWRPMTGAVTAAQMRAEAEANSEMAQQFFSDLLRISRDSLRRHAKRNP